MRHKLAEIDGLRKTFTGTFERFGEKINFNGFPEPTILLRDIQCKGDERIQCDHLWFNLTKGFKEACLKPGDVVVFRARVKEYWKGYRGYRDDVDKPIEQDYKLSNPTQIEVRRGFVLGRHKQ